jgi:hypothetical protein
MVWRGGVRVGTVLVLFLVGLSRLRGTEFRPWECLGLHSKSTRAASEAEPHKTNHKLAHTHGQTPTLSLSSVFLSPLHKNQQGHSLSTLKKLIYIEREKSRQFAKKK